jgi:predicted RNA-binding protein with PIN domain
MHIRCDGGAPRPREQEETVVRSAASRQPRDYHEAKVFDEELIRIFEQTFGKIKPRTVSERVVNEAASPTRNERPKKQKPKGDNIVIIDGYNFIFAIDELRSISEKSISDARDILVRLMCDYTSYRSFKAIIVFDGYKREGAGSIEELGSVSVIYTKERQTADAYIEKTTHDMADKHTVRVVTGDMQEQFVVLGAGGLRVSPREFWAEIQSTLFDIRDTIYLNNNNIKK